MATINIDDGLLDLLRAEKQILHRRSPGPGWTYNRLIAALLAHWQAYPPRVLPRPGECYTPGGGMATAGIADSGGLRCTAK